MAAELFIGLMSGTSLDGVDAALVRFGSGMPDCLATAYLPFPEDVRAEALAIQTSGGDELARAAMLANRLADLYGEATHGVLVDAGVAPSSVRAIGCHGQTVRHMPAAGYTLQLNNPARLAEYTGISVVADFRSRDIAAGGQGAPLVPAFHDAVFRAHDRRRLIVNIGGIANVTVLTPGEPTTGFDCGPGNMLLDGWASRHLGRPYDEDGQWARQGKVIPALLERLRQHRFFSVTPPKSCGREEFGMAWLDGELAGDELAVDVQASLVALTVAGIVQSIEHCSAIPEELFVCGGGAHNGALMETLRSSLPATAIKITDAIGLPADWVEAAAFAWLAFRTLHGLPGNLPEVTGARGPRILGAIYPA